MILDLLFPLDIGLSFWLVGLVDEVGIERKGQREQDPQKSVLTFFLDTIP